MFIRKYSLIFNTMKITREQIRKMDRRINRESELENSTGWSAVKRVHKSKKNYTRKQKHKSWQMKQI